MHSTTPTDITMTSFPYVIPSYELQAAIGQGTSGIVYTAVHTHVPSHNRHHFHAFSDAPLSPNTTANSNSNRHYHSDAIGIVDTEIGRPFSTPNGALPPTRRKLDAVKIIPGARVSNGSTRREIAIHHHVSDHEHISSLRHVTKAFPNNNGTTKQALALITEYGGQGDMFSQVTAAGCLPPVFVRRRVHEVAKALKFMHARRIVHLDVKLENVVLDRQSAAKLIDFGCARHIDFGHPWHGGEASLGGTLHYLAPETVVSGGHTDPTPAMDAWALGVLLYTALVGNYPFSASPQSQPQQFSSSTSSSDNDDDDDDEIAKMIKHQILKANPSPIPNTLDVPQDLRDIVSGLLDKNPATRMTVAKVVEVCDAFQANALSYSFVPRSRRGQFQMMTSRQRLMQAHAARTRTPSPSGPVGIDFAKTSKRSHGAEDECAYCRKQTKDEVLTVMEQIIFANLSVPQPHHHVNINDMNNASNNNNNILSSSPNFNRRPVSCSLVN